VRRFELIEPDSLGAAVAALDEHPEAKAIAGGTALLILIKHGVYLPEMLVNLRRIPGVADVTFDPAIGLRIGALASIHDVDRHPLVREHYPMLAEACHVVANIRIRNLATIGGNLAHADYQSDPPAALVALGARLELQGTEGVREVALADFILGAYETALVPAELVRAVLLPAPEPGWHGAYLKFTTRSSEDRPAVGVAALVRAEDGRCADARLVVGAVAPSPVLVEAVADHVRDRRIAPDVTAGIAPLVEAAVEPIDDLRGSAAYKRRVSGVIAERALAQCLARAGIEQGGIR
jgi:carbon-monoxide dehydrogenase medium subunit